MLQVDVMPYASDALEDAMRLAQTKSLNSFSFSDCINYLNYAWSDIYNRIAAIDSGYYSTTIKLTDRLTKLPPFVKNSVTVYSAQRPIGYDRQVYISSGQADMNESFVYHISGNDLYCPDAVRKTIWLNFVPACPQIFFTHHNRDPKIYEEYKVNRNSYFGLYTLYGLIPATEESEEIIIDVSRGPEYISNEMISRCSSWYLEHKGTHDKKDITQNIVRKNTDDGKWDLIYISCDYPYIFLTYKHSLTGKYISGFLDSTLAFNEYNPFDFTGRKSNVEYLDCHYNDKTGIGVVIIDHNDNGIIKELGWTPDTKLNYPIPEMYRYLVARLADKFSALNESNVMGVQKELAEAQFAFETQLDKNKSSWDRITNVNTPTLGDYL